MPQKTVRSWRALAAACLFLAVSGVSAQQGARISITGATEQPVRLQSVRVDAEIAGGVALTRVEMTFFNPNSRQLEGELQFPLLEGQAIVGFALDVNGKLREAVPVDKARGQAVFEDIRRQRVDPGLLQATQGNNFKLRIYPLLPGKTRTVAIRYSEPLAAANGRRQYRLPLDYGSTVSEFSLRVQVTGAAQAPSASRDDLVFRRLGDDWVGKMERNQFSARGVLELSVAALPGVVTHTQDFDGKTYFHAEIPALAASAARPAPRTVAIAWDSSGSGAERNHDREFALLDAYFRWMRDGDVHLVRLRDAAEPPELFRIKGGNWRELRRALETTVYDGATRLGAFAAPGEAEEVLLFSDGLQNFGEGRLAANGKPLYAVSAALKTDSGVLRGLADQSGGRYLDLSAMTPREAAARITRSWTRIAAVEAEGATQIVRESAYPRAGRIALAGVLLQKDARLRIRLIRPDGREQTLEVRLRAAQRPGTLAAGLWARLRLAELEGDYEFNRGEIRRLGRNFGMVTRETSLIVLETVQDYVRHEIAPPAELRAEFDRQMQFAAQRRDLDRRAHLERIVKLFEQKQAWWNREFPKGDKPAPIAKLKDLRQDRAPESRQENGPQTMEQARRAPAPASAPMVSGAVSAMAKKASDDLSTVNAITIQLKPWSPDAPYARRLREAAPGDAYRIYLDEKPGYASSTAFFLDAADLLLEKGQAALAIRVLSNLAEMDLENRHILRILGYRLLQAGRAELAIPVFRKVLELSPDEPQSWRDLGLALAADRQYQKAVDALYEVVTRPWHGRFPEIELITLAELNAVVAGTAEKLDLARIDPRLLKNLPLDLRVVLTWDADDTDIDLWVTDPNGEKAFYGNRLTYQGGRNSLDFTGGYGPEEFSLKNAKPGKYKVEAQFYGHRQQVVAGATTLQVKLATRFGTPQAKEQLITLRLKGQSEVVYVGEFTVQ